MKKDKYKIVLIFIIIAAILMRMFFICKTNISQLQFDVGIEEYYDAVINYEDLYKDFDKDYNEGRHINYIMHLYSYMSLPTKIIGQFYHPPLHHFIMASTLKIMDVFSDSASFKFESLQFVTFIYSIIILWALYKILEELEIEDKNKIIPMMLFAFYPIYIYLSGSINNDELVTMFAIICLLYLIKWNKEPNMKNAIIVATTIGLGLMTKSSMYVMIIPAIYVYFKTLMDFVNNDKKVGKLILELLVFIVIASVLGFWFQVRSFMKGLDTLGIIAPYEHLSIADESFISRFGLFNPLRMSGINIWNYLIYSSLNFGLILEHSLYIKIMVLIVITLIVDFIYFIIKNFKKEKALMVSFAAWWFFYFFLNIQMPFTCSMHSRYMLVPISIAILILGKGMQEEKNKYLKGQVYLSTISISLMSIGLFLFLI